ncbi:hypothetical protein K2173_019746 [Erythroxylum novogranatense]|uniref:Reverse transcriptase n=1 Tax=Erythroxylum novogranatense TaxID=1862640 RepID=A0AAV8SM68_9ROSI|nr:hypothetical protein K2173_019746 [Erythroxylum novogranatense]
MVCVTTVRYSVALNGSEIGPIIPKRGLRQGDSLFPYLYILCAEGQNIKRILALYEAASGQAINYQKSCIMFSSNTKQDDRTAVESILGVNTPLDHGRYLGLPSLIGRQKKQVFSFIKDGLSKCIMSWKNKLLSRPGKEVVLKTVTQALPVYCMSIFLLPRGTCEELQKLMTSF